MPQAIPVVIAAWTAVGATTIAGLAVGTIIQGAIIGAAIGGLTSAVTGGDIGKGMLFGAVGGAVVGGISGAFGGAGGGTAGAVPGGQGMLTSAAPYAAATPVSAQGAIQAATTGVAGGGGLATGISGGLLQGAGASVIGIGGQMIAGSAAEDLADKERAARQAQFDEELKVLQARSETERLGVEGTIAQGKAQLAATKEEADTARLLAEAKRQRQASAVTEGTAARRGVLSGGTAYDRQLMEQERDLMAVG